ncbi:hypothetical protein [Sessilibacter corallicola]|uniref:hypothetical protein n=1 Tax=Sessilibacter corallicola TaxID=2904075 RepID=UPI001E5EC0E7|nr:hypothetical protein [Sessilibacter corallicola]MCE2029278.1 hypothetical protein [Sessilibacter corallicola]
MEEFDLIPLRLAIIGASVLDQTTSRDDDANNTYEGSDFLTALRSQNINAGFRSFAVSGSALYNDPTQTASGGLIEDQVDEFIRSINGSSFQHFMLAHWWGNNISRNNDLIVNEDGSLGGWSQFQIDEFRAVTRRLCEKLQSAGVEIIIPTITFRAYDAEQEVLALTREDRASVVYRELVDEFAREFSANWYDFDAGRPLIDLHAASFQAHQQGIYFVDPLVDGIHPGPQGITVLQSYIAERIKSNPNFQFQPVPKALITTVTVNNSVVPSTALANTNALVGDTGTANNLRDINGRVIPGSNVTWQGLGTANSEGVPAAANIPDYLNAHEYIPDANHYAAGTYQAFVADVSPDGRVRVSAGPSYANRTALLKITSARDPDGSPSRLTDFSISVDPFANEPLVTALETIESASVPPEPREVQVQLDETGSIGFSYNATPNSVRFGYFSTATLRIDETITTDAPTALTVTENQGAALVVNIPNAREVRVSGLEGATITPNGIGSGYNLMIPNTIDFEQTPSAVLTITASNDFDLINHAINLTIENVLENIIDDPGPLNLSVAEEATVNASNQQIIDWLESTNATGHNIGTLAEGENRIRLTLADAAPLNQVITVSRKPAPRITIRPIRIVDGQALVTNFTIINFDGGTPTSSQGVLIGAGDNQWQLRAPAYDIALIQEDTIDIIADDGINPPVTETLEITVIDARGERTIPNIHTDEVTLRNPFSNEESIFVDPGRNNQVYVEFSQFDEAIDFNRASGFELKDQNGEVIIGDQTGGSIQAENILDLNGREVPVLSFDFPGGISSSLSGTGLTLIVFDAERPEGQVLVHSESSRLKFDFHTS